MSILDYGIRNEIRILQLAHKHINALQMWWQVLQQWDDKKKTKPIHDEPVFPTHDPKNNRAIYCCIILLLWFFSLPLTKMTTKCDFCEKKKRWNAICRMNANFSRKNVWMHWVKKQFEYKLNARHSKLCCIFWFVTENFRPINAWQSKLVLANVEHKLWRNESQSYY